MLWAIADDYRPEVKAMKEETLRSFPPNSVPSGLKSRLVTFAHRLQSAFRVLPEEQGRSTKTHETATALMCASQL
jgi:hypothetical protein